MEADELVTYKQRYKGKTYIVTEVEPDGKRHYDEMGDPIIDLATCGSCGRTWDDAITTGRTPAPSARCPFEYFHEYPEDDSE